MALTLFLGGARSGKSTLAVRRARSFSGPVTFLATGEAGDAEMAERIARHRSERDPGWTTIEEPLELADALEAAPADSLLIIDCLTFWVANLLGDGHDDEAIDRLSREAGTLAAARDAPTIAISNEVGMGVVPASPAGRRYRDVLGRTNAIWAELAAESALVVAGRLLPLGAPV
jgi:adenosylcobinamide kinase / adenosylcobinamide-phosphate guanylyltransferase